MTLIEIQSTEYLTHHGGLVKLLSAIELARPAGLSTRKISRKHGWETLINAEKAGYITRKKVHNDKGGPYYVMNHVTAKGRKLLKDLGESQ